MRLSSFIALFLLLAAPADVSAERLTPHQYPAPEAEDFFDWPRIKELWVTLETRDALLAEYDKVRGVYEPWRTRYKQHNRNALKTLEADPNRDAIELGYDLQLAYEYWQFRVYHGWRGVFVGEQGRWPTLEEKLSERRGWDCPSDRTKLPTSFSCGSIPDWRSETRKSEDRALYAKYAKNHAQWLEKQRKRTARDAAADEPL